MSTVDDIENEIKHADGVHASLLAMGLQPPQIADTLDKLSDSISSMAHTCGNVSTVDTTRLAYALSTSPFAPHQRTKIHQAIQHRHGVIATSAPCARRPSSYLFQRFALGRTCQYYFTATDYEAFSNTELPITDAFHVAVRRMRKLRMDEPCESACADIACVVAMNYHNMAPPRECSVLKDYQTTVKSMFAAFRCPDPEAVALPMMKEFPQSPKSLAPLMYNTAYAAEPPRIEDRIQTWDVRRREIPCRASNKRIREPANSLALQRTPSAIQYTATDVMQAMQSFWNMQQQPSEPTLPGLQFFKPGMHRQHTSSSLSSDAGPSSHTDGALLWPSS